MDLKEVGSADMHWIHLAYGLNKWWAFANMVMNFKVSYSAGHLLTS
jgi:hypothetical protein